MAFKLSSDYGLLWLPWWLSDKESTCNARDTGSIPGLGRSPRGHGSPPVFLPEKPHGQRSLVDYSPCGCKESDTTEATEYACMHGLPWWFIHKESSCSTGHLGLIPGSGRSRGEVKGNPLQYSCLGNHMDRGSWQATVHGVAKELEMT